MLFERIKLVRQHFKLSQKDFGEKMGVSRDVISNIEYNRVEAKDWFIDHLCNVFSVNKKWLLYGEGEMEDKRLVSNTNAQTAINIINDLSPKLQEYALEQLRGILKLQNKNNKIED